MRRDGLPRDVGVLLGSAHDDLHLLSRASEESPSDRELPSTRASIWSQESGATAFMFALMATGVIAAIGLGIDVIGWYRTDRALQNAADAAAIAAARNATSSYDSEARAVAANYGFVDGSNGISVTPLNNQT